jgi:glutamate-1-semialdehyde 2,1-aminomutase
MTSSLLTSRSQALFKRAQDLFPGGVNSPVRAFKSVGGEPFFVERGEGAYLIDVDGNRYIDYINSWGPLVLGHAPSQVQEAVLSQMERGSSYGAPNVLEITLAELLQTYFPSLEMMRFVSSGTEAGMAAVRLARGSTGRPKILKFSGCYHGHADSLLVSAGSGVLTLSLPDSPGVLPHLAQETLVAPFNDIEYVRRSAHAHKESLAAILVEPIMGNAGFILPQPGFLQDLRNLCDEIGALLVFDEVMTGFRVALGGAQQLYGVAPDLTLLGKVIGGGLPVGLFGGKRSVMNAIAPSGPVYQAGTLSGNPLAMASGIATLTAWTAPGTFSMVENRCQALVKGLNEAAHFYDIPFCAEARGSMWGFFFHRGPVRSYEEAAQSSDDCYREFFHGMLLRGVYFPPSRFEACFLSTEHDESVINDTVTKASEVFSAMKKNHGAE